MKINIKKVTEATWDIKWFQSYFRQSRILSIIILNKLCEWLNESFNWAYNFKKHLINANEKILMLLTVELEDVYLIICKLILLQNVEMKILIWRQWGTIWISSWKFPQIQLKVILRKIFWFFFQFAVKIIYLILRFLSLLLQSSDKIEIDLASIDFDWLYEFYRTRIDFRMKRTNIWFNSVAFIWAVEGNLAVYHCFYLLINRNNHNHLLNIRYLA